MGIPDFECVLINIILSKTKVNTHFPSIYLVAIITKGVYNSR